MCARVGAHACKVAWTHCIHMQCLFKCSHSTVYMHVKVHINQQCRVIKKKKLVLSCRRWYSYSGPRPAPGNLTHCWQHSKMATRLTSLAGPGILFVLLLLPGHKCLGGKCGHLCRGTCFCSKPSSLNSTGKESGKYTKEIENKN